METTITHRPKVRNRLQSGKTMGKDSSIRVEEKENVFDFKELEKIIMEARVEKKAGKLRQVNPKNIWGSYRKTGTIEIF
jgi:hypothetical protein